MERTKERQRERKQCTKENPPNPDKKRTLAVYRETNYFLQKPQKWKWKKSVKLKDFFLDWFLSHIKIQLKPTTITRSDFCLRKIKREKPILEIGVAEFCRKQKKPKAEKNKKENNRLPGLLHD